MIFKQLPTAISDLNKLGIALKSLETMNISSVGVNTANLEAYRTALKGLSVEQSVFALASKGATEEQIRQILVTNQATAEDVEAAMAKAGLTTATQALTQAEMVEMATKTGVAKAEAEALLSKIGITATEEGQVVVKKQVTLAMLEQAVASGTLTKAEASQIATMLGLNAVETANIGITNVLTASFTKLWAVITAHPIGAILTAIGAVAVGTIAYINKVNKDAEKALVEAHENAEQALEDTKTSLSNDKSELQSVNSELETTKEKIKEISSIGAPTLTEQNELNKLSTANAQLEAQKTLLENNIKLKQKSAALDAKELLSTQVEMEYSSILDNSSITSKKESYTYADHAKYQAYNLKNAYNIYMKALEEGNVRRQELAQELIDASAGNTAELTSKLLEIVESFKYDDGTIIDGYEDIYNEYMGMIYNLQSLTNPDTFLDIAKSITIGTGVDYEKAISEAYALAYEGNFDVDNLNQDFVKALADAGIDESTIDYIFSLKQKEYQLLVDKINNKYKVSEVPDKIKQDYWDANGNIHSEYVDVDEETKNRIEEINTINQSLNDYAKENPVEFQLVTSYDEGFTLLDKYIEEEKKKAENNTDYVGDYITNAIARIYDEAKVKIETFNNETDNSKSDMISSINELSEGFEELDKIFSSISDEDPFDFKLLDDKAFKEAFSGLDSYASFIETITSNSDDIEACKTSFNGLIDEWIMSTGVLDNVNESTAQLATSMLNMYGIQNAEEIVQARLKANTDELALSQKYLAETGKELESATDDERLAFLAEQVAAEECGKELALLELKKQLVNGTLLDTQDDINNVLALAEAAGISAEAISVLATAKANFDNAIKSGDAGLIGASVGELERAQQKIKDLIASAGIPDYTSGNNSNKSSGDSSSDKWLQEYKDAMSILKDQLDQGLITQTQFYKKSQDLMDKYLKDTPAHVKKYAKEISEAEKDIRNGLTSMFEGIISDLNSDLDNMQSSFSSIANAIEEYNESGALSIDTVQELLKLEPKYLSMLFD